MTPSRVRAFLIAEFWEVLPPTLFFATGFVLIELTTQLILDEYLVHFANFLVAIGAALVVGKAVLVANRLPFLRRFDTAPLIRPILFKSVMYALAVLVVRFLEQVLEYLVGGGRPASLPVYLVDRFSWHRFAAIQLWIFVLFLLYTTGKELNVRLGEGELFHILFTRHATARKPER
jgi:hypothetical protein